MKDLKTKEDYLSEIGQRGIKPVHQIEILLDIRDPLSEIFESSKSNKK